MNLINIKTFNGKWGTRNINYSDENQMCINPKEFSQAVEGDCKSLSQMIKAVAINILTELAQSILFEAIFINSQ